jgi:peptidoglycan hydrolase-like protein with peptidoglycan-binding domain
VDVASNQSLPVLRRGSTGAAVRRLQRSLVISELLPNTGIDGRFGPATEQAVRSLQQGLAEIAKSWEVDSPGQADGDFGPRTEASVRSFQRFTDVAIDGVVGDHTWYAQVGGVGRLLDFAGLGGD